MARNYEYPPVGTNPDQWDDEWWQDEQEEQPLNGMGAKAAGTAEAALGDTGTEPFAGLEGILGGGEGGYIPTLKQEYDEKQAKADEAWRTMGGIAGEWQAEKLRRAEEIKPRYTQAEIDDRRAKSTAISMLTSALANVANGIAVARGGLNATVPDGYTAAYDHWNDVQKRHDARRQEYDKLIDSVYQNRYGMSKAEYEKQQNEAKLAQGYLHAAQMQESKQNYELQKEAIKQMSLNQRQTNQQKFTAEQKQLDRENSTKNARIRSSNSGSGGTKKEPVTSYDYSSKTHGHVKVQFPQDMDEEEAYDLMTDAAIAKVQRDIDDMEAKAVEGKTSELAKENALTELAKDNKYKELQRKLNNLQETSATGTIRQRGRAIAAADLSQDEINSALGIATKATTQNSNSTGDF